MYYFWRVGIAVKLGGGVVWGVGKKDLCGVSVSRVELFFDLVRSTIGKAGLGTQSGSLFGGRLLLAVFSLTGGRSVTRLLTCTLSGGSLLARRGGRLNSRVVGTVCHRMRHGCSCLRVYSTFRTTRVAFVPLGNSIVQRCCSSP